ncbi:MAG TPA: CopG family transcriptional regulator [Burkholderiales bacterium]|nr:CopG family transcriptional regulator [Burkholderiales bacterium]
MKNVTITLEEGTAERARVKAAEKKMSLSRYIGELLRKELRHDDAYQAAYRAWREDSKPWPLKGAPEPYPKRDEIYDRPIFRRR